eukprot:750356-Hanusia_phi.AAC.3
MIVKASEPGTSADDHPMISDLPRPRQRPPAAGPRLEHTAGPGDSVTRRRGGPGRHAGHRRTVTPPGDHRRTVRSSNRSPGPGRSQYRGGGGGPARSHSDNLNNRAGGAGRAYGTHPVTRSDPRPRDAG